MSSKKKLQVFLSSTYRDLLIERQAAVEAILKSGHIPAGMELFAAGNQSQLEIIRQWIDESDAYMLILGGRYGSTDPTTGLSYTELEYDYAVSKEKPLFAIVITEDALDRKIKISGADALEREYPQQLKLFREKVLKRISSFFSDPKDIKLAIHETLSDPLNRYEFKGWVSGDEAAQLSPLIQELSHLRQRNTELEKEIAALRKSNIGIKQAKTTGKYPDEELEEILRLLDAIVIETTVFNKDGDDKSKELNVLRIVVVLRDTLITGVRNNMGMTDRDKLLFFNVFPKLAVHGLAASQAIGTAGYNYSGSLPRGWHCSPITTRKTPQSPPSRKREGTDRTDGFSGTTVATRASNFPQ